MATGKSACIYLRNVKKGGLFARNQAYSTPHRGLVQSRPQFSRNIHTICSTTIPLRFTPKLHLLGPIIASNQPTLKGRRPTNGAHYSTNRPPLLESVHKIVSNKTPLANDLSQPQQSTSDQIATVQLPIQRDVLSTINEDSRKLLEYANRDMLCADGSQRKDRCQPRIPRHTPSRVAQRTAELLRFKHRADTSSSPDFQALKRKKFGLPVRHFTKQILGVVNSNTYSIIDGVCNHGMATQVPQIILEDAINNSTGVSCRVLCVHQKPSIAASKARQVARERFEELGDTIFFGVPNQNACPRGTIRYCSTRALLGVFKNGPSSLKQFSHIILNDVPLRGFHTDVSLMLLKQFVEQRKSTGASVPKVILMGPFTHADDFCSYLGTTTDGTLLPAPHVNIPMGFPVNYYLEEVIGNIAHSLTPEILQPLLNDDGTKEFLDIHFKLFEKSEEIKLGTEFVPCGLVSATLLSLMSTTTTGSVLVFVPGLQNIRKVIKQITALGPKLGLYFANKDRFRISYLDSREEIDLQGEVPPGCRRILFSTGRNDFTIPNMGYVVDSGRSENYDRKKYKTRWGVRWTSRTAVLKRIRHAGRVQAGDYYFLGVKKCFDSLPVTKPLKPPTFFQAWFHVKRRQHNFSNL